VLDAWRRAQQQHRLMPFPFAVLRRPDFSPWKILQAGWEATNAYR
jgi:hypothetical protein